MAAGYTFVQVRTTLPLTTTSAFRFRIGFAHLDAQDDYNQYDFGGGAAIMGGIGFELLSARFFAVDLQGRIIEGSYHGLDDHITSGTIGVGLNWY